MKAKITEAKIVELLDWSYDKAINGLPGMETVEELAQNYLGKSRTVDEAIDKFIDWQTVKCATSGFLTGLGGIITLPVAIPANVGSVIYVQTRMVATIAYMKGYNIKDDQVRTFVYLALTGQSSVDILKQFGIKAGIKFSEVLIKRIPTEIIKQINKKVGFRLVTKFGEKGVINLGKCIPLLGGVIGGSVDFFGTQKIGKTAKKMF